MEYIIGTRGSKLALAQAQTVCKTLKQAYPMHDFVIKVISTKGDRIQNKPLNQIGDKGLFVREIEEQILAGEVQVGVHSMKDMPALPAPGLVFAKAWKREDPRDVLILRTAGSLEELPRGAVIGTGSRRREEQLRRLRPDLQVVDIRGNVDTRIRKMEEQKLDGIVLAAAGLHRLNRRELITQYLTIDEMIPAPAQGVLALEIRREDQELREMLDALSDPVTCLAVEAEREFLKEMGGDCHVPVGAVCTVLQEGLQGGRLRLQAVFGKADGNRLGIARITGEKPLEAAKEAARQVRRQLAGTVRLVGAGPGDPELITVKGWKAIQEADCIIYDRLSSPELLDQARADCELIYAGKENRNHTMPQEEINALLVEKAMEYDNVVRLKGGDPYVFGRGGEECLYLGDKGIAFEVIPGVTSAVAGLAYAGIPVTHRGLSGGFHVVTAHDRRNEMADIDFQAMASGKETCVFLMGLSKLPEIVEGLIKAGMSPDTPAAVISNATTLHQRTCAGELARLPQAAVTAGMESPALIVAGEVVRLREKLNFKRNQLLSGKRYLVPRIGKEPSALAQLLRNAGAAAEEIVVGDIDFKKIDLAGEFLEKQDWLIFTSRNGVEGFFKNFRRDQKDQEKVMLPENCHIAVVGRKTEACLEKYGYVPDLVPEEFSGEGLASAMCGRLTGKERVCYFGAEDTDEKWKAELRSCCEFQEIPVYVNQRVEIDKGTVNEINFYDGIICTCASSVSRLLSEMDMTVLDELRVHTSFYSIGPKCTACLQEHGMRKVFQADEAAYESLVECVITEETGKGLKR